MWNDSLDACLTPALAPAPFDVTPFLGESLSTGASHTTDREDSNVEVELLDEEPMDLFGISPLPVDAVVDGIQATLPVRWIEGRPVVLSYVAAGAATFSPPDLSALVERLCIICSVADEQEVSSMNSASSPVPIETVPFLSPPEVEAQVTATIRSLRAKAEREVAALAHSAGAACILVDGDLTGREESDKIVGVVKSLQTRFLSNEDGVIALPYGWISPRFKIPASGKAARYSAYVRIQPQQGRPWDHGLIRLESFDPSLLAGLGAYAMADRQSMTAADARWDRHLQGVRTCEDLLRSRRPNFF